MCAFPMSWRYDGWETCMKEFKNFIDGQWVASARTFENRNPADNSLIGRVHEANRADVDAAVAAARAALTGPWRTLTVARRVELLHAVADGINKRFDEFLDAEIDRKSTRLNSSH